MGVRASGAQGMLKLIVPSGAGEPGWPPRTKGFGGGVPVRVSGGGGPVGLVVWSTLAAAGPTGSGLGEGDVGLGGAVGGSSSLGGGSLLSLGSSWAWGLRPPQVEDGVEDTSEVSHSGGSLSVSGSGVVGGVGIC